MKCILNMSIPLAIDRTNTIIDTKTRVKVSENTIIEGGWSARYQHNNKISSFSPLFVAHLYKRDAFTQNGHINVTIYHGFNYYLEENYTQAYVSAMFSPHRMRIPTTLAVVFNSVRMGSFTPGAINMWPYVDIRNEVSEANIGKHYMGQNPAEYYCYLYFLI